MKNRHSRIVLATPPYHAGVVESAGRWMPLSLAYLAAAARTAGYEARIYDAMTKQDDVETVVSTLLAMDFDVLGVTAITSSYPVSVEILRRVKERKPNVITVLGGVHPTFCYGEIFERDGDAVDYIVTGEGEISLPALLRALRGTGSWGDVKGVFSIRDGVLAPTGVQPRITDLDQLDVAWELIDWEDYRYYVIPDSRLAAISTSRGCTFGCTFCSQQKFWEKTWRSRNPERIVSEIELLNKQYGANVFLLVDEYPTSSRDRWEELLDRLIHRRLGIYLLMETRAADIVRDKDILSKYRAAGIVHIYVGLEATDQQTLDLVKKDLTVDHSIEAIQQIHAHGMISETSFVLGFPWETKESIERTLTLAEEYGPDFAHFLAITPWPYADLYDEMKEHIAVHDYSRYNLVEPIIQPTSMSLDDVSRAMLECYKKYYMKKITRYYAEPDPFRRDYLLRSMKLIMQNSFLTNLIKRWGQDFSQIHSKVSLPSEL